MRWGGRGATAPRWGSLKVTTTNVLPGWLSRNGIPYGENLSLTEYFIRFTNKDAGDWLVIEGRHREVIEVNWRSTRSLPACPISIPSRG